MAEKGGYRHFMLKEIYEQPRAITDTFRGRVSPERRHVVLPDVNLDPDVSQASSGSSSSPAAPSYHAALVGRSMIERLAGIAAEVDLGSEFRYRDADRRARDAGGGALAVRRDRGHARRRQGGPGQGRPIVAHHQRGGLGALARGRPARSTPTPAPRSASRPPRPSSPRWWPAICWRSGSGGCAARCSAEDGRKHIQGLLELPRLIEQTLELEQRGRRSWPGDLSHAHELPLPRARHAATRSRWRARSSSRSSPTSTPRATRPAR